MRLYVNKSVSNIYVYKVDCRPMQVQELLDYWLFIIFVIETQLTTNVTET